MIITLAALPLASGCSTMETESMSSNADVVRDFLSAWSRLNAAELAAYFAEDGVYHNMPASPIQGRQKIEQFIAGFIKSWTATEWEVVNVLASGNVVMVERIDHTRMGERHVDLPCCGIFEMKNGKIQIWRDYFDMATYTRALT
jgi:limonene-1,2-epoxide hydrolase